ncbi:MAG: DJ-1/PfpI family protein [Lachnospiraceae bacterium]
MENEVCVFLADGFEEIEGLTVVDLLRRANISVVTVSVTGQRSVHGAHKIDVMADMLFEHMDYKDTTMLVLPGGMPGTIHLEEHKGLEHLLNQFYREEKYIGAICAAPSILGKRGMLKGKRATAYPSKEKELYGAEILHTPVVIDGSIVTSRGMGTAIAFSLALIGLMVGTEIAEEISSAIVYQEA